MLYRLISKLLTQKNWRKHMDKIMKFRKIYYLAIFALLFTLASVKAFSFGGGSFWPCDMVPHTPHDLHEKCLPKPGMSHSYMEPEETFKNLK